MMVMVPLLIQMVDHQEGNGNVLMVNRCQLLPVKNHVMGVVPSLVVMDYHYHQDHNMHIHIHKEVEEEVLLLVPIKP